MTMPRTPLRRLALLCALSTAAACVAKNGSEVQANGTADTGTGAPATRPTNTNATTAPASGNAAAQAATAPNTTQVGGDVGRSPTDSTTGTPMGSDTAHRRHH
jgi:hypothetical protein